VYDNPHGFEPITVFLATVFFGIQIYCDFSGYSDIALGASRIMGIELMQNFKAPYRSTSISDFWSRWHISLSTWFKDYLYIPLGGNRVPELRRFFNLFFVFLVSGFWHGANWTFIIWGALHGMFTVIEVTFNKILAKFNFQASSDWLFLYLKRLWIFYLVCFAWIFFRAKDVTTGLYISKQYWLAIPDYISKLTKQGYLWLEPLIFRRDIYLNLMDFGLLGCAVIVLYFINKIEYDEKFIDYLDKRKTFTRWSFYQLLVIFIIVFGVFHSSHEFIYFQF
jgi:D-alanyl-lipoteichoic acid acyltransferase DltB (MBOAT superfamily)